MRTRAIIQCLDAVAEDVGRLRRRTNPATDDGRALNRIADRIEGLDIMLFPTAAALRAEHFGVSSSGADIPAVEALALVDTRKARVRFLLARGDA